MRVAYFALITIGLSACGGSNALPYQPGVTGLPDPPAEVTPRPTFPPGVGNVAVGGGGGECVGTVPAPGGACDLAAPLTLATGLAQRASFALDRDFVYYVVGTSQTQVMRVAKAGGTPTPFAAPSDPDDLGYSWLAADDQFVYISDFGHAATVFGSTGANGATVGSVLSLSKAGEIKRSVQATADQCHLAHPLFLRVAGGDLYWDENNQQLACDGGGGQPFTFASVAVGEATAHSIDLLNGALFIDCKYLYFNGVGGSWKLPRDGGAQVLISSKGGYQALTSDGATTFFARLGVVGTIDAAGNETTIYDAGSDVPYGLAVDAAHLYVFNGTSVGLVRMNKDGSDATVLDTTSPPFLQLDAQYAYYVRSDGTLVKACK